MDDGWGIVVQCILSISALTGGTFVISPIAAPNLFLALFGLGNASSKWEAMTITRLAKYAYMWFVTLSVGYFLWGGFSLVVEAIPADWGGVDDDGEWNSVRYFTQMSLVTIATLAIVSSAETNVEKRVSKNASS